jgi:colicin import membrane protein
MVANQQRRPEPLALPLILSVAAHLLLAAALLVSVDWRLDEPPPVQAELWSSLPAERPPSAQPPPQQAPAPKAADPKPSPPSPSESDLALEKKKKQELQAKKEAADRAERERLEKERLERERQKKTAAEADRRKREEAEKRLADKKRQDEQRKAELARIQKSLGLDDKAKAAAKGKDAQTKAGTAGGAEQGARTGVLANYQDAIRSRIRSRIRFDPAKAPENPEAIFIVEQLPSGQISKIQLKKPSGRPDWDAAVERAIAGSDPLPKAEDGTVERVLELRFRPQEGR